MKLLNNILWSTGQPGQHRLVNQLTYINAYEITKLQVKVDVYMKLLSNIFWLTGQPSRH